MKKTKKLTVEGLKKVIRTVIKEDGKQWKPITIDQANERFHDQMLDLYDMALSDDEDFIDQYGEDATFEDFLEYNKGATFETNGTVFRSK